MKTVAQSIDGIEYPNFKGSVEEVRRLPYSAGYRWMSMTD